MPKFQIDGRVYLANDFTLDVEAEDELAARRIAKRIAWESSWSGAAIQKVQIHAVRDAERLAALLDARTQPPLDAHDAKLDELEDKFENEE